MDFTGKTIAIGVSGGIAAYRVCDLIRELYRRGAYRVCCLMTPSAQAFITPLTLSALSRESVYTSELSVDATGVPWHIVLAQQADALLIIPATADTLAKLAHGLADDPVTTTAITFTDKPVLVAPAMNSRMWRHPLTRRNIETLQTVAGYTVISPCEGHLACGETGEGHLADEETILQALAGALHPHRGLYQGVRALVSAGGTSEAIDPVRLLTNRSSGKMGLAFADELHAMGAEVVLVTTQQPPSRTYEIVPVVSAHEMQQALETKFDTSDLLIMAAAVSDYAPAELATQKLKRDDLPQLSLSLVRNPDILAGLAAKKRANQYVVGFAAESTDVERYAREKLQRKHLDAIVANDISRPDSGFEAADNEVTVFFPDGGSYPFPQAPKSKIAQQVLVLLQDQRNDFLPSS
jgi:phosphopantothenoylcysteine decarboxylase / phosphopantothenate---cysteine ligase